MLLTPCFLENVVFLVVVVALKRLLFGIESPSTPSLVIEQERYIIPIDKITPNFISIYYSF